MAGGCSDTRPGPTGVDPAAGQQAATEPGQEAAAEPGRQTASGPGRQRTSRAATAKKWGLAEPPLPAPPAPARKPHIDTRKGFAVEDHEGLPPVFTTIPTKDKVVFLTLDDGAEKDPVFLRMMSELKIPYTAFLSDYLIKEDYGYFKKMQANGVVLNNHTLHHRYLPDLSYAAQKHEICGMQKVIRKRYGKRPALFRPPFGNYNEDTLRAAGSCGIKAAPLWNEEVFVDHWEYREWDRDLHPGDIVLSHFRGKEDWEGTMPDMVRRFMKLVTGKGYAVARLEDYL
ncbi:polysaccharide deacetylase family protein [Streptomyces sp. NPDC048484]|uniref:polysaccharide deacetylase family protein n=1 Tax=Streptomyces sp. NPDC048484 TaxID=3155146 RepID=UPI00344478BA